MDEVAAMRIFIRVVETGGLAAAGRVHGLSPASVTRRINDLEHKLGVTLLNRTTRKLSLTEAGELYFERCREIVHAIEETNLAVTEERAQPSGVLKITVPSSLSRLHLTPAAAAFPAQHPAERSAMGSTDRIVDIVEEGVDIAIRVGRLEDSSLIARKVGQARRLVCASPSYLEQSGTPHSPEELTDHAVLTFRNQPGTSSWKFEVDGRMVNVRVDGPFTSIDGETMVSAASAGLGLILVPEWLVGDELVRGALVEVLREATPMPADTPLYALYASGAYIAPKIRAFVDFLAGRFSGEYAWGQPG